MLTVYDYLMIRTAHAQGESIRSLAQRLRRAQKTIRKVIASASALLDQRCRLLPRIRTCRGHFSERTLHFHRRVVEPGRYTNEKRPGEYRAVFINHADLCRNNEVVGNRHDQGAGGGSERIGPGRCQGEVAEPGDTVDRGDRGDTSQGGMSRTGDDVQTDRTAAGGDGIAELIGDTDSNERRERGAAGNAAGLLGEEKLAGGSRGDGERVADDGIDCAVGCLDGISASRSVGHAIEGNDAVDGGDGRGAGEGGAAGTGGDGEGDVGIVGGHQVAVLIGGAEGGLIHSTGSGVLGLLHEDQLRRDGGGDGERRGGDGGQA